MSDIYKQSSMPQHVAIVMDGNGRWAKARYLPRIVGHRSGAKAVRRAVEFCLDKNIEVLTLFALSVENFLNRPKKEVELLMHLFLENLKENIEELNTNQIKMKFIGDRSVFNQSLQESMQYAEALTLNNNRLTLIIAMNYSGRWDILQAVQNIAKQIHEKQTLPSLLDQKFFSKFISLHDLPEPDLLIRTSGEQRISNFLLWQLAYTELFFTDIYWPDFDSTIFQDAIEFYQSRKRRFGFTGDQLEDK